MSEVKVCVWCSVEKPVSAFNRRAASKDGLRATCKACIKERYPYSRYAAMKRKAADRWRRADLGRAAERQRRYRASSHARRSYARDEQYRRKYGIGAADVDRMIADQGHKCVICGRAFDSAKPKSTGPCVDHCHDTGVVRGVLCGMCNTGLGHFADDPSRLRSAAAYLEAGR